MQVELENLTGVFTAAHIADRRWNGWLVPSFTKAEMERLLKTMLDATWITGYVCKDDGSFIVGEAPEDQSVVPDGGGLYAPSGWCFVLAEVTDRLAGARDAVEAATRSADLKCDRDAAELLQAGAEAGIDMDPTAALRALVLAAYNVANETIEAARDGEAPEAERMLRRISRGLYSMINDLGGAQ